MAADEPVVHTRLVAAANVPEAEAYFAALGIPQPPVGLYRAVLDADVWADMWALLEEDADVHEHPLGIAMRNEVQPCPVCRGDGTIARYQAALLQHMAVDNPGSPNAPCLSCAGVGVLPTRRGVRLLQEGVQASQVQGRAAIASLVECRRELAAIRDYGDAAYWDEVAASGKPAARMSVGAGTSKERTVSIHTHRDVLAAIHDIDGDVARAKERYAREDSVVGDMQALQALVGRANDMARWCAQLEAAAAAKAAPPAAPAPAPAAPALPQHKCAVCGKPATAQGAAGRWYCKRHAYEAGAIEHTAEVRKAAAAAPALCDWCGTGAAVRTMDGYRYCAACAADAGLPPA